MLLKADHLLAVAFLRTSSPGKAAEASRPPVPSSRWSGLPNGHSLLAGLEAGDPPARPASRRQSW